MEIKQVASFEQVAYFDFCERQCEIPIVLLIKFIKANDINPRRNLGLKEDYTC